MSPAQRTLSLPRLSVPAWLIFGGTAAAALGTLLPWEHDTFHGVTMKQGPSDVAGGVALLFALLGSLLWVAWPIRLGSLSTRRLVGVAVLAAALSFFVVAKVSALGNAQTASTKATSNTSDAISELFGDDSGTGGASDYASLYGDVAGGVDYGPGLGLFVFGAGVVAIWGGVARSWIADRGKRTATSGQG